MANRNRDRGFELEREAVNAARAHHLDAQRAPGSDGRNIGMAKEVDIVINGHRLSCKRRKRLPQYLVPLPPGVNGTVFRQDGDRTAYVLIPLELYLSEMELTDLLLEMIGDLIPEEELDSGPVCRNRLQSDNSNLEVKNDVEQG